MAYLVKEALLTLQGEGVQAGHAAVFLRFTGCNLWSGRERDRDTAICNFCDTDFIGTDGKGGGRFAAAAALADHVERIWSDGRDPSVDVDRRVVCTGGEPLLQLDTAAIDAIRGRGFTLAVETNGTIVAPSGIDWLTVSPKADTVLRQQSGDECKLVFPQRFAPPDRFIGLAFDHFVLQPCDGPELDANMRAAVAYCLADPRWRLGLQTHKTLGIP